MNHGMYMCMYVCMYVYYTTMQILQQEHTYMISHTSFKRLVALFAMNAYFYCLFMNALSLLPKKALSAYECLIFISYNGLIFIANECLVFISYERLSSLLMNALSLFLIITQFLLPVNALSLFLMNA